MLAEHVGLLRLGIVLVRHSLSLGKRRVHLLDEALEERGRVVVQDADNRAGHNGPACLLAL